MDASALYKAAVMILSDWPREKIDALFLHARAHNDEDGLFELINDVNPCGFRRSLHAVLEARHLIINGGDGRSVDPNSKPGDAWPGKDEYLRRLATLGFSLAHNACHEPKVLLTKPAEHTKTENEAFLDLSIEHGWKSAALLTQPHQALRALLGMIKSMADRGYWMRVYCVSPQSTDWLKTVHGSQGKNVAERADQIEQEFIRIPRYQETGALATLDELFVYLRKRHEIV